MFSRLSRALVTGSLLAPRQPCSSLLQRFKEFIFSWIRAQGGCWIGQRGSAFLYWCGAWRLQEARPKPRTYWLKPPQPTPETSFHDKHSRINAEQWLRRFDTQEPKQTGHSSTALFALKTSLNEQTLCSYTSILQALCTVSRVPAISK